MSQTNSISPCEFDGCDKPQRAKKLCNAHYEQWRKGGSLKPLKPLCRRDDGELIDRFIKKTRKMPNGCILWTGAKFKDGYGAIKASGEKLRVHRLAYELFVGPIPDGMGILHGCPGGGTPSCVNPVHLRPGNDKDNADDRERSGRHARGMRQVRRAKITDEDVRSIRARCAAGERRGLIALNFGISEEQVRRIANRERWAHVS